MLVASWGGSTSQGFGCSPIKAARELGSEPSSRAALIGEQPNPWDVLPPQDATSILVTTAVRNSSVRLLRVGGRGLRALGHTPPAKPRYACHMAVKVNGQQALP